MQALIRAIAAVHALKESHDLAAWRTQINRPCSLPPPAASERPTMRYLLLLCAVFARFSHSTSVSVRGSYSLWKSNGNCPQVFRVAAAPNATDGLIRLPHSSIEVNSKVCAGDGFTPLLTSARLREERDKTPDLFPFSANLDLGLLQALLDSNALVGSEAFGDRVCEKVRKLFSWTSVRYWSSLTLEMHF